MRAAGDVTALSVFQFLTMCWMAALTIGLVAVVRLSRSTRDAVVTAFRHESPPPAATENTSDPVRGPNDVVAAPPTVRGDTVRDWLRYYTHREGSWERVVTEFYRRAAADPAVAPYFAGADIERLQRHFVATMVMVTNSGLTARAVQSMTVAHAAVRTPDGVPITGAVFDRVVDVLVTVLSEHGVPDAALNELARVVDPLRAAIVAVE